MIRRPPKSTPFPSPPLFGSREPRGVEYHRVGGGSERRHRPRGIGAVPRLQHIGLAPQLGVPAPAPAPSPAALGQAARSEEHTSELQSLAYLVCRLLLEKKKK